MIGALVSGQDGVAVFQEDSRLWCVRQGSPTPESVSHGLLPYLFEDISNASYHPKTTIESTRQLLDRACRAERTLHLTLISIDPASTDSTRNLAEDALEEFLEDGDILEFIENRLFSRSLPANAFWGSELAAGASQAYPKLGLLKRSVLDAQEDIGRVRTAWDALPENLFAEPDDRARFESVLVETGAFRILAIAASETVNRYSKGNAQVQILSNRRYHAFANYRNILVEWARTTLRSPAKGAQLIREERDDDSLERRRDRSLKVPSYLDPA